MGDGRAMRNLSLVLLAATVLGCGAPTPAVESKAPRELVREESAPADWAGPGTEALINDRIDVLVVFDVEPGGVRVGNRVMPAEEVQASLKGAWVASSIWAEAGIFRVEGGAESLSSLQSALQAWGRPRWQPNSPLSPQDHACPATPPNAVAPAPASWNLVGASKAHAAGYKGAGSVVAILDTGVAAGSPVFDCPAGAASSCRIVEGLCSLGDPLGCPCGPGPASACSGSEPEAAGAPCTPHDFDCQHGTKVASIVAASDSVMGTSFGAPVQVPSIAPDADLISVAVMKPGVGGSVADLVGGMAAVTRSSRFRSVVALNLSLEVTGQTFENEATCRAGNAALVAAVDAWVAAGGGAVVAAAGNCPTCADPTRLPAPACLENVVAVAGSDHECGVDRSRSGGQIDFVAPGAGVQVFTGDGVFVNGMAGTSAAAPHVAGALALLRSATGPIPLTESLDLLKKFAAVSADPAFAGVPVLDLSHIPWGFPLQAPACRSAVLASPVGVRPAACP